MLCARHCSKYFTYINTFNPHNNSMRKVLLLFFQSERLSILPKVTLKRQSQYLYIEFTHLSTSF